MLDLLLGLLAVLAGGMVLELFAASRAPFGYQDEHGFHLGIPVGQAPDASVLYSPPVRAAYRPQPPAPVQLELVTLASR